MRRTCGAVQACSHSCATISICSGLRARASRASAVPAPCGWTARSCARALCSPRRPMTGTCALSRAWPRQDRCTQYSARYSKPVPCSAPRRLANPRGGEMSTVLIRDCEVVATMDDAGTETRGGSILIEDGVITWAGSGQAPVPAGAEVIDGLFMVAVPGLVNTHHHLYQVITRTRAQESVLFDWLRELYPVWANLDVE